MKFVKYTAILGAVLTVLGFGTAQIARVNGGVWDGRMIQNQSLVLPNILSRHHSRRGIRIPENADTGEWMDDNTICFPVVNELSLELQRGNVTVTAGDEEEIRIICDSLKTRGDEVRVYQDEDELNLQIGWSGQSAPSVKVVLPKGYYFQKTDFEIEAGSCNVLELTASELNLKVTSGELVIQNGETLEADVECAAGTISYTGRILEEADVDCVAGTIRLALYQEEEAFNYEIEGAGGEIQIGGDSMSGVAFKKSLDYHGDGVMELQCAGGQIQIAFLEDGM